MPYHGIYPLVYHSQPVSPQCMLQPSYFQAPMATSCCSRD
jgi:hypothetical protein